MLRQSLFICLFRPPNRAFRELNKVADYPAVKIRRINEDAQLHANLPS